MDAVLGATQHHGVEIHPDFEVTGLLRQSAESFAWDWLRAANILWPAVWLSLRGVIRRKFWKRADSPLLMRLLGPCAGKCFVCGRAM